LVAANRLRPILGIATMFEQDGIYLRVVREEADQLGAAITSEAGDAGTDS
jgi:hypothetical protein